MKATRFGEYLCIPFTFGDKRQVMLFIPFSFIEKGDLSDCSLAPENFFGVDLKQVLAGTTEEATVPWIVNDEG